MMRNSKGHATSAVVVSRATGRAVLETWSDKVVAAINRERYEVLDVEVYLGRLNRNIAAGRPDDPVIEVEERV